MVEMKGCAGRAKRTAEILGLEMGVGFDQKSDVGYWVESGRTGTIGRLDLNAMSGTGVVEVGMRAVFLDEQVW